MDIDFGNSFGNLFGSNNGFGNTPEDEREPDQQHGFVGNVQAFANAGLPSRENAEGSGPGDAAGISQGGAGWPSPSQALQQHASGPKSFADAGRIPLLGVNQGNAPSMSLQAGLLQGGGFIGAQAGQVSGSAPVNAPSFGASTLTATQPAPGAGFTGLPGAISASGQNDVGGIDVDSGSWTGRPPISSGWTLIGMPGHGDLAGTGSGGVAPADRNISPVAVASLFVAPGGQADANSLAWSGVQGAGNGYVTDSPRPGAGLAEVLLGNGMNQANPGSRTDDAAGTAADGGYGFLGALGVSRQDLGFPARQTADGAVDGVGTFNPYSLFAAPPVGQPGEGEGDGWWGDPAVPGDSGENPDQGGEDEGGDGQAKDKGEGGEKEAPSQDGTELLTVTGGPYWHSALYIRGKSFLYDPAGDFFFDGGRPRDAVFDAMTDSGVERYIREYKAGGCDTIRTKIRTTSTQEAAIVKRAGEMGEPGDFGCASAVSYALEGVCGIKRTSLPSTLLEEAKGARCEE